MPVEPAFHELATLLLYRDTKLQRITHFGYILFRCQNRHHTCNERNGHCAGIAMAIALQVELPRSGKDVYAGEGQVMLSLSIER